MVLSVPAAKAAPQPFCSLLAGAVSFIEGFKDDPDQRDVPHLLRGLRYAQDSGLIALAAPAPLPYRFSDRFGHVSNVGTERAGVCFTRHSNFPDQQRMNRWFWSATRLDDEGRPWTACGLAVTDDFGDLVEVPE
jgi:hypothetical protein